MKELYLIVGVSGSGKTWICKQLTDKFNYLPHDEYYNNFTKAILNALMNSEKPVITECPFGERLVRDELEKYGIKVKPYFVIEPPEIVEKRYFDREKKPIRKSALTRANTIILRAQEWNAPYGNSEKVLSILKDLK